MCLLMSQPFHLRIFPTEVCAHEHQNTYIRLFIKTSFVIATNQKASKFPSRVEWKWIRQGNTILQWKLTVYNWMWQHRIKLPNIKLFFNKKLKQKTSLSRTQKMMLRWEVFLRFCVNNEIVHILDRLARTSSARCASGPLKGKHGHLVSLAMVLRQLEGEGLGQDTN